MNPLQKNYYFITAEWPIAQPSVITNVNTPPPQAQRARANAIIEVHPAVYSVMMQAQTPGYLITFAIQINKDIYESIIQTVEAAKNNGHSEEFTM